MIENAIIAMNWELADRLEEIAALYAEQDAETYRIRAYQRAAQSLRSLEEPVSEILKRGGRESLDQIPDVGEGIARIIEDGLTHGRIGLLERLRGESDPEQLFGTIPGLGPELARRLHRELHVDTLAELETAAHDGRIDEIKGFGPKRAAGIRNALAQRLAQLRRPPLSESAVDNPPVREILDVDRQYRERAKLDALPKVAPRRFNPSRERWLPILHTIRGRREYTALFSNTAHAHEAGKTRDWVVIYFSGGGAEGQSTVITAERGPLKGRRIVRGRESECLRFYAEYRDSLFPSEDIAAF